MLARAPGVRKVFTLIGCAISRSMVRADQSRSRCTSPSPCMVHIVITTGWSSLVYEMYTSRTHVVVEQPEYVSCVLRAACVRL